MMLLGPVLALRETDFGVVLLVFDADVEITYPATPEIQAMFRAYNLGHYTGTDEDFYETIYNLAEPALRDQRSIRLLP
jgi:hypothetical protein